MQFERAYNISNISWDFKYLKSTILRCCDDLKRTHVIKKIWKRALTRRKTIEPV